MDSIKFAGNEGENAFDQIIPNAEKPQSAKEGDRIIPNYGPLEIKICRANTINQVRAIRGIPLVTYAPNHVPKWYVIGPDDLVRLVSKKQRGQHTEIPFECANLSINSITPWGVEEHKLEEKLLKTFSQLKYKEDMRRLYEEIINVRQRYNEGRFLSDSTQTEE